MTEYKFLDYNGLDHFWDKVKGNFTHYGTCTTAANVEEKTVSTDSDFVLRVGAVISVKWTYSNTASNPTINVNSTGAKSVWYSTAVITTSSLTAAGDANIVTTYVYDGTNWVWLSHSKDNNSNTYDRTYVSGYPVIAGANGIMRNSLFMEDGNGTFQSFTTTNGTGTSKTKNTVGFKPGKVFYLSSTSNEEAGNRTANNVIYQTISFDSRYSLNAGANLVYSKPLYIVFTEGSDGLLYLADTWWATSLPTAEDGKLYLYIGQCHNSNKYSVYLLAWNPIYKYSNGAARLWSPNDSIKADKTSTVSDIRIAALTDGGMRLYKTINGTETALTPNIPTYSAMTQTEYDTGTSIIGRLVSPKMLHDMLLSISGMFLVEQVYKAYSISANGTVSDTIDVSKTGYTPIALAGFNVGNATVAVQRCDLWSDQTVHYTVKNLTSTAVDTYFYVKVTYIANS